MNYNPSKSVKSAIHDGKHVDESAQNYPSRTERLVFLAEIFTKGDYSVKELAARYGVTTAQIWRDREVIKNRWKKDIDRQLVTDLKRLDRQYAKLEADYDESGAEVVTTHTVSRYAIVDGIRTLIGETVRTTVRPAKARDVTLAKAMLDVLEVRGKYVGHFVKVGSDTSGAPQSPSVGNMLTVDPASLSDEELNTVLRLRSNQAIPREANVIDSHVPIIETAETGE